MSQPRGSLQFAQAPTLTSVSPSIGVQGTTVPVTLTGTNFQTGASLLFNKSGITVSNMTVVSATQITATFTIAGTAAVGAVSFVVATSGGASGAQTFTVNPAPPTLTSVSPSLGTQGASVPVTLTGTNFVSGATVSTTNTGITVSSVTVVSATQITATFTIGGSATLGATNVTVATSGGASGAQTFTVNPPAPTLTSVSPSSGAQGGSVPVTLTGANFVSGATVSTTNSGITVSNVTVMGATQITALFTIGGSATLGAAAVVVTAGGVASNGVSFTVARVPSITGLSPTSGVAGVQVTISGSGFGSAQGTGSVWLGSTRGTVVSWSDNQIVAAVASNSTSGTAQVQQGGVWSNPEPFTVNTATISSVTPASGAPGTQVTIAGSGFGAAQGSGQVWLGTLNGAVQSWSDTQIVALVAAGSASGNAQVLQNGVMSTGFPFTVNTLQLASVSPASGVAGTSVTFTGAGFGSFQGSGVVWLGSTAGQVLSWSDTQVVAAVAPTALTGIARIQQNGAWSKSFGFTVPVAGGNTVMPAMLNMVVGDTHTIQALSPAGQPVTGLAWGSSDPTVVSLSTDDPPVLTALAAGHVTITAGTASADVTVFAVALAPGTVVWSNPGDGSGVDWIVPAVPSASGVADVFAFQNDGTVQAITSDGTTAWTADVSQANYWNPGAVVPDFLGGLVAVMQNPATYADSIVKLDGITGQPYPAYAPDPTVSDLTDSPLGVHTDGTIFAIQRNWNPNYSRLPDTVIGIDPTTGTQKFSVPIPLDDTLGGSGLPQRYGLMIAGDGYAYIPYAYCERLGNDQEFNHLALLRVNSSGAYDSIKVYDWTTQVMDLIPVFEVNMITNADQGILLTWQNDAVTYGMAVTTGASASLVSAPQVPGQGTAVEPVLQAQDGSFVGAVWAGADTWTQYMVSFDATGNVRWMVPNEQPQIATADGGVIGQSGITYDQNGNATGQMANLPAYSWTQQWYSPAGGQIADVAQPIVEWATSYYATAGGNPSFNETAIGVAAPVEGIPVFALPLRGGPSCQLPSGGGTKVRLGGAALRQYNNEQQQLLAGPYLTSPSPPSPPSSCAQFFNADPIRSTYFSQLTGSVTRQQVWDGIQTNISQYDAGMSDGKNPIDVKIKKLLPVCALFVPFRGPNGVVSPQGLSVAASQVLVTPPASGPATDIYINTNPKALTGLTQGTILHEALHNLTGLLDFVPQDWRSLYGYQPPYDLKTFVGIEVVPGADPNTGTTKDITIQLRLKGCAGAN
ncbi:MAG: beta strand repeat-containing protein [Terracidiphilus sp.]